MLRLELAIFVAKLASPPRGPGAPPTEGGQLHQAFPPVCSPAAAAMMTPSPDILSLVAGGGVST